MSATLREAHGLRVLDYRDDGFRITAERDVNTIIGDAYSHRADVVVFPAAHLAPEFFQLRSGLAGAVAQKFVNYGARVVILGDVSAHIAESKAFADFVREANRGGQLWFVPTVAELEARLAQAQKKG